jgi:hypothetical protein
VADAALGSDLGSVRTGAFRTGAGAAFRTGLAVATFFGAVAGGVGSGSLAAILVGSASALEAGAASASVAAGAGGAAGTGGAAAVVSPSGDLGVAVTVASLAFSAEPPSLMAATAAPAMSTTAPINSGALLLFFLKAG